MSQENAKKHSDWLDSTLKIQMDDILHEWTRKAVKETCDDLFGSFIQEEEFDRIIEWLALLSAKRFQIFADELAERSCDTNEPPIVVMLGEDIRKAGAKNTHINKEKQLIIGWNVVQKELYRFAYPIDVVHAIFRKRNIELHLHLPSVSSAMEKVQSNSGEILGQTLTAYLTSRSKSPHRIYERLLTLFFSESLNHNRHGESSIKTTYISGKVVPSFNEFLSEIRRLELYHPVVIGKEKSPD